MTKLVCLVSVLGSLFACGGDDAGDGTGEGHDVKVEIFPGFPFDGDTVGEAQFVAVQDGDGPFVEVQGTGGSYSAHIDSDRFGVAVGCVDEEANFTDIEIIQQTAADGLLYQTYCKTRPSDGTLEVMVTGLAAGQRLRLRTQGAIASVLENGMTELAVKAGEPVEVFGTLTNETGAVLKFFRFPAAELRIEIDAMADGAAPDTSGTFTVSPAEEVQVRTSVVRPYGGIALTVSADPAGAMGRYQKLPDSLEEPGDLYRVVAFGESGSASITARAPSALAFQLPTQFEAPAPELLETPFVRPVFTFSPTSADLEQQSYVVSADNLGDFNAPLLRTWYATISAAWLGDMESVRYEFPDLSGMPGFDEVALVADERLDVSVDRIERSGEANTDGARTTSSGSGAVVGRFCGDGMVIAPETCDPGSDGETATCDDDCTPAVCGDDVVNFAAEEECDPPDGTTCDAQCKEIL